MKKQGLDKAAPTADQLALARQLGVDVDGDVEAVTTAISGCLGAGAERELARWFVVSVMRQLRQQSWQNIEDCGLSRERQQELVASFLALPDVPQSLASVLRDPRSQFTLLEFARSRDPRRQVLANTTKAYRLAVQLLEQATADETKASVDSVAPTVARPATAAVRRAARRSSLSASATQAGAGHGPNTQSEAALEHEEIVAELEQVLDGSVSEPERPPGLFAEILLLLQDDRYSMLLGVAAGLVFFLLVYWLFL